MNAPRTGGGRAALSRAFYRLLLMAYPRAFRSAHGEDATDVFADVARAARQKGARNLLVLWIRSVPAVVGGGVEERRGARRQTATVAAARWASPATLARELGQSVRALVRRPGFTAGATLTLALGIGATTAVFSVVDTVLLRPLPFADADELVVITHPVPAIASGEWHLSQAGYFYFRDHAETLDDIGVYNAGSTVISGDGPPERIDSANVTASLLSTLGVNPQLGRPFTQADDTPGAARVAILSHSLWMRSFGAAPDVLGASIILDGTSHEVIGVMPREFRFPRSSVDVWVPYALDPAAPAVNSHFLESVARLRPGATREDALSELSGLVGRFAEEMPSAYGNGFVESSGFRADVRGLLDDTVGNVRSLLWIVLATAALVLIIACANVANLTMLRAEARRRELAVRAALGASRAALLRYSLSESGIVAVAAGALGVALAGAGVRLLVLSAPAGLSRVDEIALSPLAALVAVAAVLVVAVVLGFASSLHGGSGLAEQLKGGGRSGSADRRRMRMRGAFVVTQVAMAVLLLTGSGVLMRSFINLRAIDPGFSAENVLTLELSLSPAKYPEDESALRFFDQVTERLRRLPGVTAAGAVTGLPLVSRAYDNADGVADLPDGSEQTVVIDTKFAGPGYFEALGMRLLEGRAFERQDMESETAGAVVTRSLAEEFWPGDSPLGKRMRPLMRDYPWHTIVGVIDDVRSEDITVAPEPTVYFPYTDLSSRRSFSFAIRTQGPPTALLPSVRSEVWELDPDVPLAAVATMEELVADELSRETFTLTLVGAAAAMALFLCAVGIYGVIGYAVSQRHFEIGVRMALGARAAQVAGMVLAQTMALAGMGILLGVGLALVAVGLVESLLFEVAPTDPLTLGAVALGLGLVAALAGALPARRATRVDAIVALQSE